LKKTRWLIFGKNDGSPEILEERAVIGGVFADLFSTETVVIR